MVKKLTNKKIIKLFNKVSDKEVREALLKNDCDLCSLKFLREHEKAFRSLIPTYFDRYISLYNGYIDESYFVVDREDYMLYVCLEHGIIDLDDFTSVLNLSTAGIFVNTLSGYAPSVNELFREGVLKLKDGDKKLVEFVDKNPEYLYYFLPLIFSIDSEVLSQAMSQYIKSAGLEDNMRMHIFRAMLESSDVNMLRRSLDDIETNNYYRFKAMNEATIMACGYSEIAPKELVMVLKDAINGNYKKYVTSDFKHAYNFIKAYDRLYNDKFFDVANEILNSGSDRARWALLFALNSESINGKYAKYIFERKLTYEDLSFFNRKIDGEKMDKSVLPTAFENLFGMLVAMDKVNYHYKVDDDITFARDVYKAILVSSLGKLAITANNQEYIKRLDSVYDTLKEEAQAYYLNSVGDKTGLDRRLCAIKFLKTDEYTSNKFFDREKITLNYDEAVLVSDFLKSKKESVKSKIIKAFLSSKDSKKISEYLLTCKEDYKKAVGEEMQKSLGKVDSKKLEKNKETNYLNFGEAESVFVVEMPKDEIAQIAKQKIDVKPIKILPYKRVKDFFEMLDRFIEENKDYEYSSEFREGYTQFGSKFERLKGTEISAGRFNAYPLGNEIKSLIEGNFTQEEIAGILMLFDCVHYGQKMQLYFALCECEKFGDAKKNYDYVASLKKDSWEYWGATTNYNILKNLNDAIEKELLTEKTLLSAIATYTQEKMIVRYGEIEHHGPPLDFEMILSRSNDVDIIRALLHMDCVLIDAKYKMYINMRLTVRAYENGFISDKLARFFIRANAYVDEFFNPESTYYVMRSDYEYPKFKVLLLDYIESALKVEFNRGSLETPDSRLLMRAGRFFGVEKFFKAIVSLRGITWVRSPYGTAKDDLLSQILKCSVKAQDDTYDKFVEYIKKYNITNDELIKATLFNPDFVDYTAKYLDVPYLKLAVFWFIAHLNETLEGSAQERKIEQIKEFSDISYPDFKDGAFDYKWYEEMVEKVPEKFLKQVYANAKYVTIGGLHKRAQRFFDAVGGRISKAECLEKINSTRNKDYCLIYSLIPIESREDLLERYTVLAEFIRSGKQFGAQRQLSERRTVDIAMENLARVAGYASADIFIFEMEAENPSDIFKTYTIDDIAITPYIDESKFKITYNVQKDGKKINSIPSKYSKNPTVVEIRDEIKKLNQKFRRIINSLENTMNNRVEFTLEQLSSMRRESIIATALDKLVFISDGRLCVFDKDFKSIDGGSIDTEKIYVAHPVELKKSGLLQSAIEYVVKNNIRQPFKQVLREIYTKTDLELEQDEVLRFKGFEVDLKKCIAALKGKGWGVCEEIGLRKVYYRSDVVSAIFREFDLLYTADFDNVNRELHGIFFLKRKSGEIIPIKDVDDITFSETLRDVDLMISISSKVIYDFALAMSTVEMRHEVLKSIVGILALSNVSFLKDNIKVEGKWGTYVINIRTGLVFKEGKGNLALDTVYSVDKPILLDFVDEDPMTADIISKAVVLANDSAIRDSAILREIKD